MLGFGPEASGAALPPGADPFYVAPSGLAARAPGAVLRSRSVEVSLGPVPVTGPAHKAYQLLYRTNDASGRAMANVTTVIVPNAAAPAGGRHLVSVDDAEDSVDPNCAPSYQLQNGELAGQGDANLAIESTLALAELARGRDVVIPDAEGPQSEYIVTGMEGRATLDSIRAAERFAPAELSGVATRVGLVGYSGGGHVTAAADELQPGYAAELKLAGVAAGGVPVGNQENVAYLDGSVGSGVLMAVSIAINRAYPVLDLYSLLNARGRAFAQQVSTGCASSVFAAPYVKFDSYTTVPNVFTLPRVARIIATNALGHATPTAPSFFYNAVHDELISIKPLDQLLARYCSSGATISYFRDPAGLEHIQGVADFAPLALAYLDDRFAGKPAPSTCGVAAGASTPTAPAAPAGHSGHSGHSGRGRCARPSGRLAGRVLGPVRLGMTRARARRQFARVATTDRASIDFFCLTSGGIRVGYPSRKLLGTLSRSTRSRVAGRVVLALTASRYYALRGVRAGATLSSAKRALKIGPAYLVGRHRWYFAPGVTSTGVLLVRNGVVQEIGIADRGLTASHRGRVMLVRSF